MRNKIPALILSTLMTFALAGCASEEREGTDGTTNAGTTEGTESRTGGAADAMDGGTTGSDHRDTISTGAGTTTDH